MESWAISKIIYISCPLEVEEYQIQTISKTFESALVHLIKNDAFSSKSGFLTRDNSPRLEFPIKNDLLEYETYSDLHITRWAVYGLSPK